MFSQELECFFPSWTSKRCFFTVSLFFSLQETFCSTSGKSILWNHFGRSLEIVRWWTWPQNPWKCSNLKWEFDSRRNIWQTGNAATEIVWGIDEMLRKCSNSAEKYHDSSQWLDLWPLFVSKLKPRWDTSFSFYMLIITS